MSGDEREGGCLCGSIRLRVAGAATHRGCCHCRSCRLASGAPFVAWATFPAEELRVLWGRLAEHRSSPPVRRTFCPTCGTALTYAHDARPGEVDVAVATLDDAASLAPEFHLWVSHKLPWVEIADGLPQYPEWPAGGP